MKSVRKISPIQSLETNYLAVIYECLTNLAAITIDSKNSHDIRLHDKIRNQRLHYFATLAKYCRGEYGLYYFKNNKARLDITSHVMYMV